jgi:hypothetical protein
MVGRWRYEPLDLNRFPPGEGPFRVRGVAFVTALSYVKRRLPGGREALVEVLGVGTPVTAYCDQAFDPAEAYDASILLRLLSAAAKIAHAPLERFIEARSRWSAKTEQRGMLKSMVGRAPEQMAKRLHLDFMRYFRPTTARSIAVTTGRFEGELEKVPAPMNGLYVGATVGFVSGALELTGAREVRFEWGSPVRDGVCADVPLERLDFVATWTA